MLFNSYAFLLVFLPASLAIYAFLGRERPRWAIASLVFASLLFYGWWTPEHLPILVCSLCGNFAWGRCLAWLSAPRARLAALATGIVANLACLSLFKYSGFAVENANAVLATTWHVPQLLLPLGLSFFTFTQIAYLVDVHRGETREANVLDYALFVTFFPHLIAGPILHHREMMSQFADRRITSLVPAHVAVGLVILVIGLFKKTVIADSIGEYASLVFNAARASPPTTGEAWAGALSYTLQLYFDFSAYSDMAIGIAWMFNVRMPLNFFSPYKAKSLIDFWRLWHITLSRWLRAYVYIPLGGNRFGRRRTYVNLLATMLLGGIWHGAGWTFACWGLLHGIGLVFNHAWRGRRGSAEGGVATKGISWAATFLFVVVGWVLFRAADMVTAKHMYTAMCHASGTSDLGTALPNPLTTWEEIAVLLLVAFACPNTAQLFGRAFPSLPAPGVHDPQASPSRGFEWRFTRTWAVATGLFLAWGLLEMTGRSEFLYFRF